MARSAPAVAVLWSQGQGGAPIVVVVARSSNRSRTSFPPTATVQRPSAHPGVEPRISCGSRRRGEAAVCTAAWQVAGRSAGMEVALATAAVVAMGTWTSALCKLALVSLRQYLSPSPRSTPTSNAHHPELPSLPRSQLQQRLLALRSDQVYSKKGSNMKLTVKELVTCSGAGWSISDQSLDLIVKNERVHMLALRLSQYSGARLLQHQRQPLNEAGGRPSEFIIPYGQYMKSRAYLKKDGIPLQPFPSSENTGT